jgi:hypothetical protein
VITWVGRKTRAPVAMRRSRAGASGASRCIAVGGDTLGVPLENEERQERHEKIACLDQELRSLLPRHIFFHFFSPLYRFRLQRMLNTSIGDASAFADLLESPHITRPGLVPIESKMCLFK